MKTLLFAGFGVAVTGLAIAFMTSRGHAQAQPTPGDYGPGPQGAALVPTGGQAATQTPFSSAPANPAFPGTAFDPRTYGTSKAASPSVAAYTDASSPWAGLPSNPRDGAPQNNPLPRFEERPDINQDIAATTDLGPYMICVITYFGEKAPQMARDLVMELRNTYKLPSYVFNHGAVERRKEYERVKDLIQQRREIYRQNGVPDSVPIRVPCLLSVDDQCAVLIGGYRDEDAAKQALVRLRALPPPNPNKVMLDTKLGVTRPDKDGNVQSEAVYVNPLKRAFVGYNPAAKADRAENKFELRVLENLNHDEPLSLLKCPKKVTLVVKQIVTAEVVAGKKTETTHGGFMDSLMGMGKKLRADKVDGSATVAHVLAEMLREMRIESYVLHTTYSSIVTVGAFDSMDDPALRSMQHLFQTQILRDPRFNDVKPYPVPIPWEFGTSITRS